MKKAVSIIILAAVLIALLASTSFASPAEKDGTKLIAHRGYSGEAPENTLAAFRLAAQNGFDACEFDIWPTKDRIWVVMHDDTVDRMTDGTGAISEMTLEQIRGLRITSGNGIDKYPDEKIPTLNEALAVCESAGITPVIEIKNGDAQNLASLASQLEESGILGSCTVISFNRDCLTGMRALCPDLDLRLLIGKVTNESIAFCKENNIWGISCNYKSNLPHRLKKLRESGLIMTAWTVNDTVNAENLINQGFEYITTDSLTPGTVSEKGTHSFADDIDTLLLRLSDFFSGIFKNMANGCGG